MSVWLLYLLFLKSTVGSFSGFASVPIVREELVVRRNVLTDDQVNAAVAISQTSPGPLGLYIVPLGYFVGGLPGAGAAIAAIATPAFVSIPLLSLARRRQEDLVRGASRGIVLASSVLMLFAASHLAAVAVSSGVLLGVFACSLVVLVFDLLSPIWVVAVGALVGFAVAALHRLP